MYEYIFLEKLRSYAKMLTDDIINNSKRKLLNHKWYKLLRELLTTVQYNPENM